MEGRREEAAEVVEAGRVNMKQTMKKIIKYFTKNIFTVVGLVLVWRGIWYVLDGIDGIAFGGSHMLTSIGGVVVGLVILYIPDRDLKEIEKL